MKEKKINILEKILSTRITDKSFKIIFFTTAISVIGSVVYLLLQSITFKESFETIAKQKSITIIDESGTVFKKRLYETNMETATIFGITFIKKAFGYGYLNYNRILNFVKVFSSEEVTNNFISRIKSELKQINILNGTNIVKILQYKMTNKNNSNKEFELFLNINKEFISESTNVQKLLFVKMKITFAEPTNVNASGIYVTNLEFEEFDTDKHSKIFNK